MIRDAMEPIQGGPASSGAVKRGMPWNTLLGELSECLKADYGEESTGSQASDADGIIPKMRRILLQLMGSCTRERKYLRKIMRSLIKFASQPI